MHFIIYVSSRKVSDKTLLRGYVISFILHIRFSISCSGTLSASHSMEDCHLWADMRLLYMLVYWISECTNINCLLRKLSWCLIIFRYFLVSYSTDPRPSSAPLVRVIWKCFSCSWIEAPTRMLWTRSTTLHRQAQNISASTQMFIWLLCMCLVCYCAQ